jgi:iron complex outermembrane recepter protein
MVSIGAWSSVVFGGFLISSAQTVAAQDTPARSVGVSEGDIVVTARRVAERLQDVPLAVSAVSSETLDRQSIRELKDLTSTVPNLSIYTGNSGGADVLVSIRGQVQSNTGLLFVDPSVGVYVDGLNVPRNTGLRSGLVDVERVEVLRGPQGTLYGRNTTGGAVSIITKDPANAFGGSVQGTYGNYNAWNLLGVLNVPLAPDLAIRFVAQHGEHDAYGHQVLTGQGLNDERSTYLRGKLKYNNGTFRATLSADYFRYRSKGIVFHMVGLTPPSTDPRFSGAVANVPGAAPVTAANPDGRGTYVIAGGASTAAIQRALGLPLSPAGLDQASTVLQSYTWPGRDNIGFQDTYGTSSENYGLSLPKNAGNSNGYSITLDVGYNISDTLSIRSITGTRHYKRYEAYDFDSTPFPLFATSNSNPYANFYSQELQILGNTEHLNWVVGGFYSYEKGEEFQPNIALQAIGATNYALGDGTTINRSTAIFAQGTYKFTNKLSVTLGARYTWDKRQTFNRRRSFSSVAPDGSRVVTCGIPVSLRSDPLICEADLRGTFSDPSWLASLDYKFTPDVLVYAKYARGYRSGGVQGRANVASNPLAFQNYEPEILTEYELGLKMELLNGGARLNVAAFRDDYSDVQRSVTRVNPLTGAGFTLVSNAATARLYGVEAETRLRVTDALTLNGSVSYLDAKYKEFQDFTLGDRSGEPWPAPKWTFSIGGTYDVPTSFGSLLATVAWDYRSRQNLQPQAIIRIQNVQPGFGLLNGRISAHVDAADMDVALFGRNILNKNYYVSGISLEAVGFNTLVVGAPRTYGIQVTKRFR